MQRRELLLQATDPLVRLGEIISNGKSGHHRETGIADFAEFAVQFADALLKQVGERLKMLLLTILAAEAELTGGASPRVIPFADVRDMGALLQRAGFALPVADTETYTVRYDSLFGLIRDLRAMGMTNPLASRNRKPMPRRFFLRAAEFYAQRFSDPDGRIRATFSIIYLSGWAPHESQQKPLKPGSAKQRLSHALGASEHKLKDEGEP